MGSDVERMQTLADELDDTKIQAVILKWLAILPCPFDASDYAVGLRQELSILQAEFALPLFFRTSDPRKHSFRNS